MPTLPLMLAKFEYWNHDSNLDAVLHIRHLRSNLCSMLVC